MRGARYVLGPVAATAFLTRVPVGRFVEVDAAAVARAAPLYPLLGAAVGAGAGVVCDLAAGPLPTAAAAALALAVAALLTGAMHLDALADTADALGGATRERRLEIMRDHAVGSFGVAAVALVLLFEAALLATLAIEGGVWRAFATAGACSRLVALPLASLLPYARPAGQGAALAQTTPLAVVAGLAVTVAVVVLASGADGLIALGAAGATAAVLGLFFWRWLGGVTGDTLGATTELAQATALASLVVTL
jgi:adenosylcobinamide-GDP ribazoletransferase